VYTEKMSSRCLPLNIGSSSQMSFKVGKIDGHGNRDG
jgi:hypothetical protein